MKLVLTQEAHDDLGVIADWIAESNPTRAISMVQELRMDCRRLLEYPQAYPILLRLKDRGVRRKIRDDYLIFYKVVADSVIVLRILHGARDYEGLFSED